MALSNIFGWNKDKEKNETAAACGTACGASDQPKEQPEACGGHLISKRNSRLHVERQISQKNNQQHAEQHVEHLTSKK